MTPNRHIPEGEFRRTQKVYMCVAAFERR